MKRIITGTGSPLDEKQEWLSYEDMLKRKKEKENKKEESDEKDDSEKKK